MKLTDKPRNARSILFAVSVIFIAIILFTPEMGFGQQVKDPPSWVKKIDPDLNAFADPKLASGGVNYLLVDEQLNTVTKQSYAHYAMAVLTEEGLTTVSQIEFSFDPSYQTAVLHKVYVYRNGQKTDRTKEVKFRNLSEENQRSGGLLNGTRTLFANLSDIRRGDIVEYSYSLIGNNPIYKKEYEYSFITKYKVPIAKIHYLFLFPKDKKPFIKSDGTDLSPKIKEGDFLEYTWEFPVTKPREDEDATPAWFDNQGTVYISSFKNWQQVKQHCLELFKLRNYQRDGVNRITDSIKKRHVNIDSQISALVDFVQLDVRYSGDESGIYSHVPRMPDYVLKNRYGDCKEKTVLLNELLKNIGIEAFPILVNTYYRGHTHERAPGISAFNHVITGFKKGFQYYFIDPTVTYQRGDYTLRIAPAYEKGILLDDDSSRVFIDIERDLTAATFITERFLIKNDSGDAELFVETIYTGNSANRIRYMFQAMSFENFQKGNKEFYEKYTKKIELLDTLQLFDNKETNQIRMLEHYKLPGFWKASDSSKTAFRQFAPFALTSNLKLPEARTRKTPLEVTYPLNYTQTIIVINPAGWNIAEKRISENNGFFDYNHLIKVKEDRLILNYTYEAKTEYIEPYDYNSYLGKMEWLNDNLVFNAMKSEVGEEEKGFNTYLLLAMLLSCVIGFFLIRWLQQRSYESLFEQEYDSLGGLLLVVAFLMGLAPVLQIYRLFNMYAEEFSYDYSKLFFEPNSPYFAPLKGYYALISAMFNVLLVIFAFYLLYLLAYRRNTFRPYYCIYKLVSFGVLLIDVIISYFLRGQSDATLDRETFSNQVNMFFVQLIGLCIWTPYIWYSERSRGTFTVGNPEPPTQNVIPPRVQETMHSTNEIIPSTETVSNSDNLPPLNNQDTTNFES